MRGETYVRLVLGLLPANVVQSLLLKASNAESVVCESEEWVWVTVSFTEAIGQRPTSDMPFISTSSAAISSSVGPKSPIFSGAALTLGAAHEWAFVAREPPAGETNQSRRLDKGGNRPARPSHAQLHGGSRHEGRGHAQKEEEACQDAHGDDFYASCRGTVGAYEAREGQFGRAIKRTISSMAHQAFSRSRILGLCLLVIARRAQGFRVRVEPSLSAGPEAL